MSQIVLVLFLEKSEQHYVTWLSVCKIVHNVEKWPTSIRSEMFDRALENTSTEDVQMNTQQVF